MCRGLHALLGLLCFSQGSGSKVISPGEEGEELGEGRWNTAGACRGRRVQGPKWGWKWRSVTMKRLKPACRLPTPSTSHFSLLHTLPLPTFFSLALLPSFPLVLPSVHAAFPPLAFLSPGSPLPSVCTHLFSDFPPLQVLSPPYSGQHSLPLTFLQEGY